MLCAFRAVFAVTIIAFFPVGFGTATGTGIKTGVGAGSCATGAGVAGIGAETSGNAVTAVEVSAFRLFSRGSEIKVGSNN